MVTFQQMCQFMNNYKFQPMYIILHNIVDYKLTINLNIFYKISYYIYYNYYFASISRSKRVLNIGKETIGYLIKSRGVDLG